VELPYTIKPVKAFKAILFGRGRAPSAVAPIQKAPGAP
jgi:hypothetical protein